MNNQTVQEVENAYAHAFEAMVKIRQEFIQKPGYIRKKTGDELRIQAAKKVFGEFKVGTDADKEAMRNNTNHGKGIDIELEDGSIIHFANQLELFDAVVEFNREHGNFYDEKYIKTHFPDDYQRLKDGESELKLAKKALMRSFGPDRQKEGYKKLTALELAIKQKYGMVDGAHAQQGQHNTPSSVQKNNPLSQASYLLGGVLARARQKVEALDQSVSDRGPVEPVAFMENLRHSKRNFETTVDALNDSALGIAYQVGSVNELERRDPKLALLSREMHQHAAIFSDIHQQLKHRDMSSLSESDLTEIDTIFKDIQSLSTTHEGLIKEATSVTFMDHLHELFTSLKDTLQQVVESVKMKNEASASPGM